MGPARSKSAYNRDMFARRPTLICSAALLCVLGACDPAEKPTAEDAPAGADSKTPAKAEVAKAEEARGAEEAEDVVAPEAEGEDPQDEAEAEVTATARGDGEPPPALNTSCEDDSDCATSHSNVREDGTCCIGCGSDPGNVVSVSKLSRWCSDHIRSDCPKKKCASPPDPTCQDGKCVAGS